jgi:hypothetical protein
VKASFLAALALLCWLAACSRDEPTVVFDTPGVFEPPVVFEPPDTDPRSSILNFDAAGNRLARFDVAGNEVDAHGGEIERFGDSYYWYGEHYGCGFQWTVAGTPFCGFHAYVSPDLEHWTDLGEMWPATINSQWQAWCGGHTDGCFRPRVVYNQSTGRYVMWLNAYQAEGGYWVFTSKSPGGDFTLHTPGPRLAVADRPYRGDEDLFVDDDGTAYIAYTNAAAGGDIVIEELDRDFLNGDGRYTTAGLKSAEAPSLFKYNNRYYLQFSDPHCGFCTTGTSYVTAPSPLGPWSRKRAITATSCGGQPSHVSVLPAADGGSWYMYQSDLWNDGEANEATAGHYWARLSFDSAGAILPIACEPRSSAATMVSAAAPEGRGERWRLTCDIGGSGRAQREVRFAPTSSESLTGVSLAVFQKGSFNSPQRGPPNAALIVELRSLDGANDVLATATVDTSQVSWAARQVMVPLSAPLAAGKTYGIRLRSSASRGCYGLAFRDDVGTPLLSSYQSGDNGTSWTFERNRTIKTDLAFAQP